MVEGQEPASWDRLRTQAGLEVESDPSGPRASIRCSGEIDCSNVGDLRRALSESIGAGARALEVDLRQVDYFDSSTIEVLLLAQAELALTERPLRVRVRPAAVRLLCLLRLERLLD